MPIYDPLDHESSILRFSEEVERIAKQGRGMRITEAVIALADREKMEPEFAATLLTPALLELIQEDAEKHRAIKKITRLRFS